MGRHGERARPPVAEWSVRARAREQRVAGPIDEYARVGLVEDEVELACARDHGDRVVHRSEPVRGEGDNERVDAVGQL